MNYDPLSLSPAPKLKLVSLSELSLAVPLPRAQDVSAVIPLGAGNCTKIAYTPLQNISRWSSKLAVWSHKRLPYQLCKSS